MRRYYSRQFRRQIFGMVVLAVLVVVFSCVLVMLWVVDGSKDKTGTVKSGAAADTGSSDIEQLAALKNKTASDVASVTVSNKNGGYTILPAEASSEGYRVKELEGLPQNASMIQFVLQNSVGMSAIEDIGSTESLSEFGLNPPAATVTLHFLDGTGFSYHLGNTLPLNEESMYMCSDDSDYVYVVDADSRLMENCAVFVDTSVLNLASGQGSGLFSSITLSGTSFPSAVSITRAGTSAQYHMGNPVDTDCDTAAVDSLTAYLTGLTAKRAVAVHPDQAQLASYGLNPPAAQVEYVYNGASYQLSASKKDDSSYYVMRQGTDVVYEVSSDYVKNWAQTDSFALREKNVLKMTAADAAGMTLRTQKTACTLTSTRTKDEFKSTETKPVYTYSVASDSGKTVSSTNYLNFFTVLSGISLSADAPQDAAVQPAALTLSYTGFEGGKKSTVELLPYNERQFILAVNGQNIGLIASGDAQAVIGAADHLGD